MNSQFTEAEMRALALIDQRESVIVPCRRFVFPQYTELMPNLTSPDHITVERYFEAMNIPPERLTEVFDDGLFTKDGRQILTDIIGKNLIFADSPRSNEAVPPYLHFSPRVKVG